MALHRKDAERAKNMFALGLLSWLYHRPLEGTRRFLETKFGGKRGGAAGEPDRAGGGLVVRRDHRGFRGALRGQAGRAARRAGTARSAGTRRWPTGWSRRPSGPDCRCSSGTYPITPASDILHELSALKNFGVRTFQAEDEIAGVAAALGASYGGSLGVTTHLGPGRRAQGRDDRPGRDPGVAADHRRRAARRPVHRAADQDRAGRPAAGDVRPQRRGAGAGDRRAKSPSDCFTLALEAARIATTYRTPVFLLSDGYLANGSEPWLIPSVDSLPDLRVTFATAPTTCADRR